VFLDLKVGALEEPLTGRRWDRPAIMRRFGQRVVYYQAQGLAPGDRVFVHFGNTLEFFVDLLAIWSLGGCVVPIDARLTPFEMETMARCAAPRFSLWHGSPDPAVAAGLLSLDIPILDAAEGAGTGAGASGFSLSGSFPALDQDALILFTSGTTGEPKGVVHTHRSLRARWMSLRQSLGIEKFRRTLCLLPTHFGHGLICNCLFPWLSGQDLVILPPFRSDLVLQLGRLLDEHRITFFSSVPSVWRLALKTARPPKSRALQRVFCGSAPLSATLWKAIQEWTGSPEVLNAYGITETASWLAGTTTPGFVPEDGLIGEPWGSVVKILRHGAVEPPPGLAEECAPGEPGYVWVNTPALMRGYLGREDLTNQVVTQGWFSTWDIGFTDDRGLLYLKGREREEINKGGMKVYPGDVDAVVERFEQTLDVCTFGYEDALYGENVGIAVVLSSSEDETLRGLHQWAQRHLAKHQMPLRWYVVDEIPRTSRGKVSRAAVAGRCADLVPLDLRRILAGVPGAGDPS
jgi:oxalate---CoA ligase